jgi:hypothetical protein
VSRNEVARIFGFERGKMTEWGKKRNEEINDSYVELGIVLLVERIGGGGLRWIGHVARMGRPEIDA